MKTIPHFLWGTSTSSHQVEGANSKNDWWEWEVQGKLKEASGAACEHYTRYEQDFDIISKLGQNAHRFSLEWSRLEPEEGVWDEKEFAHYSKVLQALHDRGIEPLVTLHHFTTPVWLNLKGGWTTEKIAYYFGRFTKKVVEALGPQVRFWCTINEPLVFLYHGFYAGLWPPGIKSQIHSMRVFKNMVLAHMESYKVIHEHYKKELQKPVWVSIAAHVSHFTPCNPGSIRDRIALFLRNWFFNDLFVDACVKGFLFFPGIFCEPLPARKTLDYIGLNYYTRDFIRHAGDTFLEKFIGQSCDKGHHPIETGEKNMMDWEVYPEGLYHRLKHFKHYDLPIIITENGIATMDDNQRKRFIENHLSEVGRAMKEGVHVQGYFYWSLLDNFEWAHGFGPRFGIVEVDYKTQQRNIRESAYVLSEMCRKIEGSL